MQLNNFSLTISHEIATNDLIEKCEGSLSGANFVVLQFLKNEIKFHISAFNSVFVDVSMLLIKQSIPEMCGCVFDVWAGGE
jgi:hypothetical protein